METYINEDGLIKILDNKYADYNIVKPFKNRLINPEKKIRVYRNLHFKNKVVYSIVQNGITVAHAERFCLRGINFVVSEKCRQRILNNKRKEFCGYAEGFYTTSGMGTSADKNDLPVKISFNPYINEFFIGNSNKDYVIKSAWFAIFSNEIRASYVN